MTAILVGVDVEGIQRWVFSSNRLRHVAGASELVELATSTEEGGLLDVWSAQVVAAGGGNAVLCFEDPGGAAEFAASYGRQVIERLPDLDVTVVSVPVDPESPGRSLLDLGTAVARAKATRARQAPLAGLAITAPCAATGKAAAGVESQPDGTVVPASAQVMAAVGAARGRDRWDRWLPGVPDGFPEGAKLAFPAQLDQLGRTFEVRSKIGVVHVDGDGVGARLTRWLKNPPVPPAAVLEGYGRLSTAISTAMSGALHAVTGAIGANLAWNEGGGGTGRAVLTGAVAELDFALAGGDGTCYLPIRPVLAGGDDLTFVCDGRIALDLAAVAVDALAAVDIDDGEGPLSACAGVAIGASHTPFVRLYDLAEQLCRNAKDVRRAEGWAGGALDWHIDGAAGRFDRLDDIRRSAYQARDEGRDMGLTMRPYWVGRRHGLTDDARRWGWLRDELLGDGPQGFRGPLWSASRGKARNLADQVRWPAGADRTLEACRAAGLVLPAPLCPVGTDGQLIARGAFPGQKTPLLDGLELLGLAQRLNPVPVS